jgi:hypothetical protein
VRLRIFMILAVVTLFASSTLGQASGASRAPSLVAHGTARVASPSVPEALLYSQNDNDSTIAISSQNFEASLDAFDDQGADDFTVPGGVRWGVKAVVVTGQYVGSGPAASETVSFYRNSGGLPGALISSQTVTGVDNAGSFNMRLPSLVRLRPGTYWVSVQANMDFTPNGQWFWETRTVQSGNGAAWQNPGDGFGSGCTSWASLLACIPTAGGPDLMFALYGKAV